MQRDILLLTEMVDAAEQAGQLTAGITVSQLETDRQRPGDRTGKRAEEIFGGQRAAGTSGEPSRGLGQLRRFGGLPQ
jgi:hypothetical protein